MKKIGILIGLILICQIYGAGAIQIDEGSLDQSQTSLQCVVYNTYLAQSFKPSFNQLTKIELALYTSSKINPINITLSIRSRLYGKDIASTTISSDFIPYNSTHDCYWGWIEFDFDDVELISGKKYWLVLSPSEGRHISNGESVMWFIGWSNPYKNGGSYVTKQFLWLPTWLILTNIGDFSFKTYG
jgi:hypothetical protein